MLCSTEYVKQTHYVSFLVFDAIRNIFDESFFIKIPQLVVRSRWSSVKDMALALALRNFEAFSIFMTISHLQLKNHLHASRPERLQLTRLFFFSFFKLLSDTKLQQESFYGEERDSCFYLTFIRQI